MFCSGESNDSVVFFWNFFDVSERLRAQIQLTTLHTKTSTSFDRCLWKIQWLLQEKLDWDAMTHGWNFDQEHHLLLCCLWNCRIPSSSEQERHQPIAKTRIPCFLWPTFAFAPWLWMRDAQQYFNHTAIHKSIRDSHPWEERKNRPLLKWGINVSAASWHDSWNGRPLAWLPR